ncbi:S1C family serine protease [Rhodopirellula sp. MGV]|uniref:S1C family serine protease n=1 Tax=Rhodopirellula sp. MGV TaxID=2023130 RepID=UPI000B9749D2|nr:S1C family serine protease [Rhodopirellula sp. MGV]OYP36035.1 hypothetical protein CGZ80_09795 [Rhodopirellula sp. MGV]PNY36607.1 PDZ domain-containing protein [Rhodopirellula baltica]
MRASLNGRWGLDRLAFAFMLLPCVSATAQTVVDFRDTVRSAGPAVMRVIVEPDASPIGPNVERKLKREPSDSDLGRDDSAPKLRLQEIDPVQTPLEPQDALAAPPVPVVRTEVNSAAFAIADDLVVAFIERPVAAVRVVNDRGDEVAGQVVVFDHVTGLAAIRVPDAMWMPLVISVAPIEAGMPVVALERDERAVHANAGTVVTEPIPADAGVGLVPEISFLARRQSPGSPVLDATGIVVGVLCPSQENGLVCTDASILMRMLNAAPKSTPSDASDVVFLKRGLIGIQFDGGGALVKEVSPKSAAESAGIQAGDLVTRVGAVRILHSTDVIAAVEMARAGDTLELDVMRDGQSQTVSVTLQEHPQQWLAKRGDGFPMNGPPIFQMEDGQIVPFPGGGIPRFEHFDQMFRRFDRFPLR